MTGRPSSQVVLYVTAATLTGLALWYLLHSSSSSSSKSSSSSSSSHQDTSATPTKSNSRSTTTASTLSSNSDEKSVHRRIEEIDRAGKALFHSKQFLSAAETFSQALDLIQQLSHSSSSLTRQILTLTNNRSAMYEKAGLADLALADCDAVLALDASHSKARTRRLRLLETQSRYREALVEVCALQLKYMQDNRDKIRLGLPPPPPPVSQTKIEELVGKILPEEMERLPVGKQRALPSEYTVAQLLQSFSGYHRWMGEAARGGTVEQIQSRLQDMREEEGLGGLAKRATLLAQRGRRYAFEKNFGDAVKDFDEAYRLVMEPEQGETRNREERLQEIETAMGKQEYARLLEWVGMCRHLRYDLKGALECYERSSELEPDNTELLVKRAGVKMDASQHSSAEKLFQQALDLNSTASDALLHRANLRMLQQRIPDSQSDLETCVRLYPNHLLARLRLATVYMANEDLDGAKKMLDKAEEYHPDSSEVHCYRGELHFAQGEFEEAKSEFEKAMKCDPCNPTPYVNAALAVVNTPPSGGAMMPNFVEAIEFLEKAIQVDPMFHTAYVQLGQMKLSMATDLTKAREVVELYDRGLEYCRTPEELKDICSMRILTVAQIDAAHALRMETLNMQ